MWLPRIKRVWGKTRFMWTVEAKGYCVTAEEKLLYNKAWLYCVERNYGNF